MDKSQLRGFRIVTHTYRLSREGGGRVGYHCPDCGCFYAEGGYTIENATHVLGAHERKRCCWKDRPTPLLFETPQEVHRFLSELKTPRRWEKATLIEKKALIIAHFDKKVFEELKRKTLH